MRNFRIRTYFVNATYFILFYLFTIRYQIFIQKFCNNVKNKLEPQDKIWDVKLILDKQIYS